MSAITRFESRENLARLKAGAPAKNDTLADKDFCIQVLERFERQQPCGEIRAAQIGSLLTAAYPTMKAHSPAEYAKLMASTIANYPERVALEAMDKLTQTMKFLPTRADVFDALEAVMDENRKLARTAKHHLEERERREREEARSEEAAQSRAALRGVLGTAWDDWWNIPTMRRFNGGTAEAFAKGYQAAADKAEFCKNWGIS